MRFLQGCWGCWDGWCVHDMYWIVLTKRWSCNFIRVIACFFVQKHLQNETLDSLDLNSDPSRVFTVCVYTPCKYLCITYADWSSSLWNNAMPARRLPATGNGKKRVNSANLDMRWSPSRTSNFKHRTWIAGLIAWTVSHRTGSIRIRATWACDQVPTHLPAELIFATAWSGAAICSYVTDSHKFPTTWTKLLTTHHPPKKNSIMM